MADGRGRRVELRFYAELNDFLPPSVRSTTLTRWVEPGTTVKDAMEAVGVPHTEVDLVLVGGESVDFSHQLDQGDQVSVYPVFEAFDLTPVVRVRPAPLRETRFLLDTHLGRLARHLRLLGFDSRYHNAAGDEELAGVSVAEHRILLTRDVGLLKRRVVTHGHWVRATDPLEQAVEVVRRFDLVGRLAPFSRCLACNGRVKPVGKDAVADRLPRFVRGCFEEFSICGGCSRIYWKGSHYDRLLRVVEEIRRRAAMSP